jgi:two-component system, sensor histidine kinase and response regulator
METLSRQKEQDHYNLVTTIATPWQSAVTIMFVCILLGVVLFIVPFRYEKGPESSTFLSSTSTLICLANLITAYVLFTQFLYTRLLHTAILAVAYLFSSLIIIPYALTFPAVISKSGLLGAGSQTAIWLYVFWHAGLSVGMLLYIILKKRSPGSLLSPRTTYLTLAILLVTVPALIILLTLLALHASSLLPPLIKDGYYWPMIDSHVGPLLCLINLLTCSLVFFLLNDKLLLHAWLKVTAVASLLDVSLLLFSGSRYSLGWYVSRINSVIAAAAVLFAILYEINQLYRRLKRQNDDLLKQQSIQDNFIAVIGHEFRTALTSIAGFSELMYLQNLPDEEIKEFSHDISVESARMNRLINELLDLERMKTGNTVLRLERIELNSLVAQVIQRMQPVFLSQKRHLSLDLDMNLPPLWGDLDKLTQVITNLLSNAIKYSPKDSTIFVSSKKDSNMAHLLVRDQGMGISPEQLEHVFQRYSRIESLQTRYIGGLGLGLAIVRQIVEMHHGRVWVESQVGQGSTFHLTLPLANMLKLIATHTSKNSRLDHISML